MKKPTLAVQDASLWASNVWAQNLSNWENRSQDYNYRKLLARPGMQKILQKLPTVTNGVFVDLGCGDGSELCHISNSLIQHGNCGTFYGFDLQANLIRTAASKFHNTSMMKHLFDFGQLAALVKKHVLNGNVDRVFSTFLLQELSDAESYCQMVADCLNENGIGVFLLLHPDFGNAMLKKAAVLINSDLERTHAFQWAGEYPIVEENGNTFYVPYFHREMDDYMRLLHKHFSSIKIYSRKPSLGIIKKAQREKLSPFYSHAGNVYYPEIIKMQSSLFFVVAK